MVVKCFHHLVVFNGFTEDYVCQEIEFIIR